MTLWKHPPARDKAYRRWINWKPCIFCGNPPPNACCHAHTGGMGTKCSDYRSFPACPDCHYEYDTGRKKMLAKHPDINLEKAMDGYKKEYDAEKEEESLIF